MKCHFVYSVPATGYGRRLRRRVFLGLQRFGSRLCWFGDRDNPDMRLWPRRSPYENTRHIFLGLSRRVPAVLYALDEQVRCDFSAADIFLGHPRFPAEGGKMGVTELSIDQTPRPRIFALISPLHCDTSIGTTHINKAYLDAVDRLLPRADVLFAIMGEYWWDQWPNSPYAHWMDKMVRLDMAIDTTYFPRVKRRFNPPGKRGFLYIGRNDPMKGTDFLSKLAHHTHDCRWGWIGSGSEIDGIPRLSGPRPLTPDYLSQLAEEFDFFINTSVADPNPTTILESMAWGFPVICTAQSGYYETSYRRNIYLADLERSIGVLRELQTVDEASLHGMADEARRVVDDYYMWDRFTGCICSRLGLTSQRCGTE